MEVECAACGVKNKDFSPDKGCTKDLYPNWLKDDIWLCWDCLMDVIKVHIKYFAKDVPKEEMKEFREGSHINKIRSP